MITVRPLAPDDAAWAQAAEEESWHGGAVARRGELIAFAGLAGCIATLDGRPVGIARYAVRGDACELVSILVYQHFGFDLVALHHGAVAQARRLKPSIPETGADGIPLAHELELELRL
jgi:hypothetical protein